MNMKDFVSFNFYQEFTRTTAIYNKEFAISYTTLGLCGESGEVAEKVKKIIRDNKGVLTSQVKENIKNELGDVLWYLARLSDELGYSLQEIAQANMEKLKSRKKRDKIKGNGDTR